MKQAKQQSQELRQTDEFLTTIMKPGHIEKEKAKHSPPESISSRPVNGRPKMPRVDSFSRFSDPPAPPPQQPLPEKPDAPPRNGADSLSPLKRTETEKPKLGAGNSPVSRDSSQIISLIETLASTRKELDSQGARVKELETLLLQERNARESAEERARNLEMQSKESHESDSGTSSDEQPDGAQHESTEMQKPEGLEADETPAQQNPQGSVEGGDLADDQATKLQRRLEAMMADMEEMRKQVSLFKDRAEKAETETVETRKSLGEMIETLRREHAESRAGNKSVSQPEDSADVTETLPIQEDANGHEAKDSESPPAESVPMSPNKGPGSPGPTFATQTQRHDVLQQSSPYASMLGVVLLGVGLMAYLNGWQKMDK